MITYSRSHSDWQTDVLLLFLPSHLLLALCLPRTGQALHTGWVENASFLRFSEPEASVLGRYNLCLFSAVIPLCILHERNRNSPRWQKLCLNIQLNSLNTDQHPFLMWSQFFFSCYHSPILSIFGAFCLTSFCCYSQYWELFTRFSLCFRFDSFLMLIALLHCHSDFCFRLLFWKSCNFFQI